MPALSPRSPKAKWYCASVVGSVRSSSGATDVDYSSVHGPPPPAWYQDVTALPSSANANRSPGCSVTSAQHATWNPGG